MIVSGTRTVIVPGGRISRPERAGFCLRRKGGLEETQGIDCQRLLELTADLGYLLLENGAEIYRVEESMERIFAVYGVTGDVFAIPTCIVATVLDAQGRPVTVTRRIRTRINNFDKVMRLNSLSRKICAEKPGLESYEDQLNQVKNAPVYPAWVSVPAVAGISLAFTLFFGGTLRDGICSGVLGIALQLIVLGMGRLKSNQFFTDIVASGICAGLTMLAVEMGLGDNADMIIIGLFMNLVPGIAMTNAVRDIIAGDLVAGSAKVTEALMIGIALALGAGIAISCSRYLGGL